VRRGRTIAFCEVKAKGGRERGDPLEMVTPEKMRRIARAAEAWLAARPEHGCCEARFDFVALRSGRLERLSDPS
jgi:putative endonuclease